MENLKESQDFFYTTFLSAASGKQNNTKTRASIKGLGNVMFLTAFTGFHKVLIDFSPYKLSIGIFRQKSTFGSNLRIFATW